MQDESTFLQFNITASNLAFNNANLIFLIENIKFCENFLKIFF